VFGTSHIKTKSYLKKAADQYVIKIK